MPELVASELMEEFVTTLSPDTDVHTAMETLLNKKLPGAPVVDEKGIVVGILSEKDCLKIVTASAFEGLPHGKVADYMTTDVVTITPRATVFDIVNRFLESNFRRLPVVNDDRELVGVVSRSEVVKAIASMRDNTALYGSPDNSPPGEEGGVDSAMRRARGQ